MQTAPRGYRRRQYLVETRFQLKYVGLILLLMYLTGIVCSYLVYYTGMMFMGEKLASVYPQGRLVSIVNVVNVRILVSLVLATPLVAIIGIFLSHRIAGPWYRMEKFMISVVSGDLTSLITLRKNDELIPLANRINDLVESLRTTIKSEKAHLNNAFVEFEQMKKSAGLQQIDASSINLGIKKLESELKDISKELEKYKV